MKQEEVKKAVTAAATVAQVKPDEATINGENKPAIQDAKTAAELAAQPAPAAPEAPVQVTPPAEIAPVAPAKPELSFDGIFAEGFSLGSVIRQNPNGSNSVQNLKKPAFDYVEQAKNKKNLSLTPEEFAKQQAPKK